LEPGYDRRDLVELLTPTIEHSSTLGILVPVLQIYVLAVAAASPSSSRGSPRWSAPLMC
jgi:hypothetical protein